MSIQKNQEAVVINPETQVVVFYHKNCNDGFVAGFVWWLHHLNDTRIHQYIPLQYKEQVGDLTGKQVVMLDVTVTPKQFQEIKRVAKSVLVLDHHEGTLEDYQKAFDEGKYGFNKCRCSQSSDEKTFHFPHERKLPSNVTFSKEKQSGALMAYDYLLDEPIPNCSIAQGFARKQLKYICERISDRDLWNFNYPDSKAVYEVISSLNFDFQKMFELLMCTEKHFKSLVEQAQIRVDMRDEFAMNYAQKAEVINFMGYDIPAVNCPENMKSETGDTLNSIEDIPFSLTYVINSRDAFCSLRSRKQNSKAVNVFELAKKFGGGGHRHAAGFKINSSELMKLLKAEA